MRHAREATGDWLHDGQVKNLHRSSGGRDVRGGGGRAGGGTPTGIGNHEARVWFNLLRAQRRGHPLLHWGRRRRRQGRAHLPVAVLLLRRGQEIAQGGPPWTEVAAPIRDEHKQDEQEGE